MKCDVKNIEGKVVKSVDLDDTVFNVEINEALLHTAAKVYRANKRQGTHATKTRSTINGTGKKPFKQKGTGGARQGSMRGPHQYGGAVSHGPQPRDYRQDFNKKQKQLALKVALSNRARMSGFTVVDDLSLSGFSTKNIIKSLSHLGAPSALILDDREDAFLYRSARNIYKVGSRTSSEVNVFDVLTYPHIVVTEKALGALTSRLKKEGSDA